MKEFLLEHPWLTGFVVLFVVPFVINLAWRLRNANKELPREVALEWEMMGASRALRKLARARRRLYRGRKLLYTGDRALQSAIRDMLVNAKWDASEALKRLSRLLKKSERTLIPTAAMRNMDWHIRQAHEIRDQCDRLLKNRESLDSPSRPLNREEIISIITECRNDLGAAQKIIETWAEETARAECDLARTVDPTIFHSRGTLRNPLKRETPMEVKQTTSVLNLFESKNDLMHVRVAVDGVDEAIKAIAGFECDEAATTCQSISSALEGLDKALGDSDLPLPQGLASGDNPYQHPSAAAKPGALERIYDQLVQIEASMSS